MLTGLAISVLDPVPQPYSPLWLGIIIMRGLQRMRVLIPAILYYLNGKEIRRDEGLMSVHYLERTIKELLDQVSPPAPEHGEPSAGE